MTAAVVPLQAEDAVKAYVTQHSLSHRATEDLLSLLHRLSMPELVEQTRRLPLSARTFRKQLHSSTQAAQDGIIRDELRVAEGNISVFFPHFDVAQVIRELLQSYRTQSSVLHFDFQRRCVIATGERVFDELHSGTFWRDTELKIRDQLARTMHVLPIILYVDGLQVDFFGKVHMTPIMLTLGNLDATTRQTLSAKRLVGFVPSLSEEEIRTHTTKPASAVRREILHSAFTKYVVYHTVTLNAGSHVLIYNMVDDGQDFGSHSDTAN